jgi:hypothetical protein
MITKKNQSARPAIAAILTALLLVAWAGLSSAQVQVPQKLTHQGRVLDSSSLQPLGGVHPVTFTLYDNGAVVWTETLNVAFDNGYYTVTLGQNGLADDIFDSALLSLGVQIAQDAELSPRIALNSVPYAFRAQVADDVVGDINPTSVNINGVAVINGQGQWVGDRAGLQGPIGPQGVAGPQGEPGPQGDSADPGQVATILSSSQNFRSTLAMVLVAEYADELRGPVGPQGPTGPTGAQGELGPQGPVGPIGPAGQDADPVAVADNLAANEGFRTNIVDELFAEYAQELTGPQGPIGLQGLQGVPGPVGPQGLPGDADPDEIAASIVNNPALLDALLADVNARLDAIEDAGYVTQDALDDLLADYVPRTEFNAAVTNLQNQINGLNQNLTNQVANLQTQIDANETAITTLSGRVNTNTNNISNLQTALNNLTTTVNGHTTQLGNLTTTVNGHTTQLTTLTNRINGLATDLNNLTQQVGTNATNIANLTNRVNTNTTNVQNNTTAISGLTTTVNNHTTQITALQNNGGGTPFILGKSTDNTTGRINVGGKKGLAGANAMCRATFTNVPTAHICTNEEVSMAISFESWDTNNTANINNVRAWTNSTQQFSTVGGFASSTQASSCHNLNYNSGDIARGSTIRIFLNGNVLGNGGQNNTNFFNIDKDIACSTALPVMCCR